MTLETMTIIALLVAVGIPALYLLVRKVDKSNPRFQQRDWVAESKRRVTHNGFKSRAGIR